MPALKPPQVAKLSYDSIRSFLETVSIVCALLLSIITGVMFGQSYDDFDAMQQRTRDYYGNYDTGEHWAQLGSWCGVMFGVVIIVASILYVDLGLFVDDASPDHDNRQMAYWVKTNKYPLILCGALAIIGIETLLAFFYYSGYFILPVKFCASIKWKATGGFLMVFEGVFLLLIARNWLYKYPHFYEVLQHENPNPTSTNVTEDDNQKNGEVELQSPLHNINRDSIPAASTNVGR